MTDTGKGEAETFSPHHFQGPPQPQTTGPLSSNTQASSLLPRHQSHQTPSTWLCYSITLQFLFGVFPSCSVFCQRRNCRNKERNLNPYFTSRGMNQSWTGFHTIVGFRTVERVPPQGANRTHGNSIFFPS